MKGKATGFKLTTVYAEYPVVNHHAQRQVVKHVREMVPDVGVAVFPRAFCVEPIRLCYTSRLVVAPDKVQPVGVAQLEAYEQRDGLD